MVTSARSFVDFPVSDPALVGKATALQELLRRNAPAADANRRVPDENIAALTEAGLFRILKPKRFGGHQARLRTMLEVSSEIGMACGSTAWVVMINNVVDWLIGLMPMKAQQEIFGPSPDVRISGVLTPSDKVKRVEGGYVVSGKWPFASGCLHASWGCGGFLKVDDAGSVIGAGVGFAPIAEFTIEDTWFTTGMRGTGSNTLVAKDLFFPDHRILDVDPSINGEYQSEHHRQEALYRSAFVPVLAIVLVGPILGMARAALDQFVSKIGKRGITYTSYATQSQATITQIQLAQAVTMIDAAHMHAFRCVDDIESAAAAGVYPDPVRRARMRMDAAQAGRLARDAVNLLMTASGASGMAQSGPLERIWRDANTADLHAVIALDQNLEIYGQMLLGLPPITNLI
jgi:alkylation response protein AidB-like acyl-CoA dehydrogenase